MMSILCKKQMFSREGRAQGRASEALPQDVVKISLSHQRKARKKQIGFVFDSLLLLGKLNELLATLQVALLDFNLSVISGLFPVRKTPVLFSGIMKKLENVFTFRAFAPRQLLLRCSTYGPTTRMWEIVFCGWIPHKTNFIHHPWPSSRETGFLSVALNQLSFNFNHLKVINLRVHKA
jgi:hypothetical protein